MHSTQKGDIFEHRVYILIKEMIDQKQFIVNSPKMKLFAKKKYYSKTRGANIVIDLSVECFRAEAALPNLYVFIECKDYEKSVPVDDIEEFHTKMNQISGFNVKGLFFVTSSLQSAALNFAHNTGIGVVRVRPDNATEWLVERSNSMLKVDQKTGRDLNVLQALINPIYIPTSPISALVENKTFIDLFSLFEYLNAEVEA